MSKPMLPDEQNIIDADDITLPEGWSVDPDCEGSLNAYENKEQFKQQIKQTLPQALQNAEQLVRALNNELRISLPSVYLVINSGVNFHLYLPMEEPIYHSPKKVAAGLLAERLANELINISVQTVFTIDEETDMKFLTSPHEYLLVYKQA